MVEFIPLAVAVGAGIYVSQLPRISAYSEPRHFLESEIPDYGLPVYSFEDNAQTELDEFEQNGIPYSIAKVSDLSMTNINDAWKPYGPPRQIPSKGIYDTFKSEAERNAYVRTYGMPPYIRRHEMEIPYTSANQNNYSVIIPSRKLEGTPFDSLQHYPRVWVDEECWDHGLALADPEFRVWGANFCPSEWMPGENHDDEGRFSKFLNPWGLNGAYIDLFRKQHAEHTRRHGIPQPQVIRPNTSMYRYTDYDN